MADEVKSTSEFFFLQQLFTCGSPTAIILPVSWSRKAHSPCGQLR